MIFSNRCLQFVSIFYVFQLPWLLPVFALTAIHCLTRELPLSGITYYPDLTAVAVYRSEAVESRPTVAGQLDRLVQIR